MDTEQILLLAIVLPAFIINVLLLIVFTTSLLRRWAVAEIIRNKFVMLVLVMTTCFMFSTLFLFVSRYGFSNISSDTAATIDLAGAAFFLICIFLHVVTLYLRTDALLVPSAVMKTVRVLIPALILLGILSSRAIMNRFAVGSPGWIFCFICRVFTGIIIAGIDLTYTYFFTKYVHNAQKILVNNQSTKSTTSIIARNGRHITIVSCVSVILFLLADMVDDPDDVLMLLVRSLATAIPALWIYLKLTLDRERRSNSNTMAGKSTTNAPTATAPGIVASSTIQTQSQNKSRITEEA